MYIRSHDIFSFAVVPRKGDVDRNLPTRSKITDKEMVVPRKGDVDRNKRAVGVGAQKAVVPRKGDVDRNTLLCEGDSMEPRSSPARGTWIEIS